MVAIWAETCCIRYKVTKNIEFWLTICSVLELYIYIYIYIYIYTHTHTQFSSTQGIPCTILVSALSCDAYVVHWNYILRRLGSFGAPFYFSLFFRVLLFLSFTFASFFLLRYSLFQRSRTRRSLTSDHVTSVISNTPIHQGWTFLS